MSHSAAEHAKHGRTQSAFVPREISWLNFNERVLMEAMDPSVPLMERLVFLGIFSNNLDEFFRVRVASLARIVALQKKLKNSAPINELAATAEKTLAEVKRRVKSLNKDFERTYKTIRAELAKEHILIIDETGLDEAQGEYVRHHFQESIRPHLFPMMLDKLRNVPNLRDRSVYLVAELKNRAGQIQDTWTLIELPTAELSRFVVLPKRADGQVCVMLLDDVIRYCMADLFGIFGYDHFACYTIKFTRDSELSIDNDVSRSYLEVVSDSIKRRKYGHTVRFIYDEQIPPSLLEKVRTTFGLKKRDTLIKGGKYHNFKDFMAFPKHIGAKKLSYPDHHIVTVRGLIPSTSILDDVRQHDVMLHYPYHSFQYIIDLLREASIEPTVRAIKVTIYRVAKESKIIAALINAARNGKKVTVYVELEARFDEEANIYWVDRMQEEGIHVIPKLRGYKVHAKLILIRRKESGNNVYYTAIGTGNLNEDTTRFYGDDHLLTSNKQITSDVNRIFHLLDDERITRPDFNSLIVSPYHTRDFFLSMIDAEIASVQAGREAWMMLKINNLTDAQIVSRLEDAARAGVKVKLIVRGMCSISPKAMDTIGNIEAIRIIDRFLEHSRCLVFANRGEPRYFLSSSDWMERNFDHRIEVSVEITDAPLKQELEQMLRFQWSDTVKARIIGGRKTDSLRAHEKNAKRIVSQTEIAKYLAQLVAHTVAHTVEGGETKNHS